jgi:hypothetical protein
MAKTRRTSGPLAEFRERLDRNQLIPALNADDHLILVTDGHLQLHRVWLLRHRAGDADAHIQQRLELLVAVSRKIERASSVAIASGTPRARQAAPQSLWEAMVAAGG